MALMRGFDPVACMEAIVRDRLTVFVGLSLMYQAILDHRAAGNTTCPAEDLRLHHGAMGRRCWSERSRTCVPISC